MRCLGYINVAQLNEETLSSLSTMESYNCYPIFKEIEPDNRGKVWHEFIDNLREGDTAVLTSLKEVFQSVHDMIFFLKLCFRKNIRLISIDDSLDFCDEKFKGANSRKTIEALVSAIESIRLAAVGTEDDYPTYRPKQAARVLKFKKVIRLYNEGLGASEIQDQTGYSKSGVYRILRSYRINLAYPRKSMRNRKS